MMTIIEVTSISHQYSSQNKLPATGMPRVVSATFCLLCCASAIAASAIVGSALAMTGNAPPATGWAARGIVMLTGTHSELCTATALARDLLLTAAHCVMRSDNYEAKPYQTGIPIAVRSVALHPRFDAAAYAVGRASADIALVKLIAPLPDIVVPAALAAPRRVKVGETLTIAGFGITAAGTDRGLGQPREAKLTVTGVPGSLQIRLYDIATRNTRGGLGACAGDSGAPAYDGEGPLVIGVVGWSTAPNDEDGCGGLTGLTPLLNYRGWIVDTARKFNSPLAP